MAKITEAQHTEKAVFVGVIKQGDDERQIMEYLDELEFLAETAGAIGVKILHNLTLVVTLFDDTDEHSFFIMLFYSNFCHKS